MENTLTPDEINQQASQQLAMLTALSVIQWPPYRVGWVPDKLKGWIAILKQNVARPDSTKEQQNQATQLLVDYRQTFRQFKKNQTAFS